MAVILYGKGELSSGFYGYRTVVAIRGAHFQKWFTLRRDPSIPFDLWRQYQETRARYYEARWLARSAACQYIDFIRTDSPTTKPHRGLGFQGMTIGIGRGSRCLHDQCYFQINKKGNATRFWITERQTMSKAWVRAIRTWGDLYEIREKDIQGKLDHPPSPDIFKQLRMHLNEYEGKDFPPSVLHHVYAEQRRQIENLRNTSALKKAQSEIPNEVPLNDELFDFYASLERDISTYKQPD